MLYLDLTGIDPVPSTKDFKMSANHAVQPVFRNIRMTRILGPRAVHLLLITIALGPLHAQENTVPDSVVTIEREIIYVDREYIPPFAEMNGVLYFTSDDGTNGKELWSSDGAKLGTRMVKDINPWGSSNPRYLTVMDGNLYFQANDGLLGIELWRSDGTEGGTFMVSDIYPASSSNPSHLFAVGGLLYFQANDGMGGIELWRSDGTSAGTVMVRDINPYRGAFPRAPHGEEWEAEE